MALPWYPYSLRSWVEQTSPSLPLLTAALVQASTALVRFQASGESPGQPRVHRDVKPDNFLVRATESGLTVVLADFGGARAESLAVTKRHSVHYTPRYAPPEQTLLRAALPDPGVDAHALAVTLYWCITTREPDAKGPMVPYTPAGRRLLELQSATNLSGAEAAELSGHQRRALGELLDLDDMAALTTADVQRLHAAIEDELRREGRDYAAAADLLAPLLHALRRALHPDPERRDGDLRKLVAACEALAGAVGVPPRPVAPLAAVAHPPLAAASPSPPRPSPPSHPQPPSPITPTASLAPQPSSERDPMAISLAAVIGLLTIVTAAWVWLG